MRVLLVSCYELGHQPLGVAGPAGRLRAAGHEVRTLDLSIEPWEASCLEWPERVACSVPMHTATRLARQVIADVRRLRPEIPVACYGLYGAAMTDAAHFAVAGETDEALLAWVEGTDDSGGPVVHLNRDAARPGAPRPARELLPTLDRYSRLLRGGSEQLVASTEASRGCVHRCRHCPVPVVYDGRIRVVALDAVLADVEQQVAAGAEHLTFADPDFLNGVAHSRRVVDAVHTRFPDLTFDCTVKVEHVLAHPEIWSEFAAAGCLFIVSAFESVDDATLHRLDKGHTVADEATAVGLLRVHGIEVRPSWLPFTPWTTLAQVQALLDFVAGHDLVGNVDPVQYTIRLLLPPGSLLLDHPDVVPYLDGYDPERASHTWRSADPTMDDLQRELSAVVEAQLAAGESTVAVYQQARAVVGLDPVAVDERKAGLVPRLSEPWFCCAEPTAAQLAPLTAR
ncbi:MAG TPA: CUAEP/CCAEP-tail radical SAM protein [Acidimicrobiia bacterium]|nr:CUAEP/CCAEP-tail radical SAM protein [Acidimicrobiia bacterium]